MATHKVLGVWTLCDKVRTVFHNSCSALAGMLIRSNRLQRCQKALQPHAQHRHKGQVLQAKVGAEAIAVHCRLGKGVLGKRGHPWRVQQQATRRRGRSRHAKYHRIKTQKTRAVSRATRGENIRNPPALPAEWAAAAAGTAVN